jgi:hypothetical protein
MFTNSVTRSCATIAIFLYFSIGTAFSQLQNEGVIGASFFGETVDSTGSIQNQVGPNADFAVPVGLSANAELSSLFSGTSSKLVASLRLDDGTLTRLSGDEVKWESASGDISFSGDFLTANGVTKKKRIAVIASAQGYTDKFFVILKKNEPTVIQNPNVVPVPTSPLSNATDLAVAGWKKSAWFGNYYDGGNDWIHHLDHGWLFTSSDSADSIWLWSTSDQWLWTGPGVYPHLFRNRDSSWLYFVREALPQKVFYNQTKKAFEKK